MPKQQAIVRRAMGLFRQYNRLHSAPEGAMILAENLTLDRDGAATPRRGFSIYGQAFAPNALFYFQDRLIGHASTSLKYDSDGYGTWIAHSGVYYDPDSKHRMRAVQARKALYLTSSAGLLRTDAYSNAPVRAGVPAALDLEASATGTGASWFTPDSQVGYRVLWGRYDANDQLFLGAPAFREAIVNPWVAATWAYATGTVTVTQTGHGYQTGDTVVADSLSDVLAAPNSTITRTGADTYTYTPVGAPAASGTGNFGKAFNALLRFTIPRDIVDGDFFEIYRTVISASSTVDPGDECKRVSRVQVSQYATKLTACTCTRTGGTVTVTLNGHGFQVGDFVQIASASHVGYEEGPHVITAVATNTFDYTVAGTPTSPGTLSVRLLTVTYVDGLDEAFLGEDCYTNPSRGGITQAKTRPPLARDVATYKGMLFALNTQKEEYVDLQFLAVSGLVDNTSAIKLTTGVTTTTYTFSTAEDVYLRRFKRFTTYPTLAQNIRETMKSLCRMINRDISQSSYYAWYTSGINEQPGLIAIERQDVGSASFSITANDATCGGKWFPNLPTSGTDVSSLCFRMENGLYYSPIEEPDAMPDGWFEEVGDPDKPGLRLIATRDSLLVVKEDGVWRISGDTPGNFIIKPLDVTIQPRCPETWRALDGAVWGLTTKGVVRVTESGTELMSQPVADDIHAILEYPNSDTITHAISYESEFKYILCAQETALDAAVTVQWVFSSLADVGPTVWRKAISAGLVPPELDRLVVTDPTVGYVLRERKSFTAEDRMDEDQGGEVTAVGTYTDSDGATKTTVTVLFTPRQILAGDAFRRTPSSLPWSKVRRSSMVGPNSYALELNDYFPGLDTGTCVVAKRIPVLVEWKPETGDNAGTLKAWISVAFQFEDDSTAQHQISFRGNFWGTLVPLTEIFFQPMLGGMATLRVPVPRQCSRGTTLVLRWENWMCLENFTLDQITYNLRQTSDVVGFKP